MILTLRISDNVLFRDVITIALIGFRLVPIDVYVSRGPEADSPRLQRLVRIVLQTLELR